jgi:hypothetical protein
MFRKKHNLTIYGFCIEHVQFMLSLQGLFMQVVVAVGRVENGSVAHRVEQQFPLPMAAPQDQPQ